MQTVHDLRAHADAKLFAGEFLPALHAYAVLVQLQPNDLDARLRLADTLLAMGEVQAAGLIYMKLAQHAANAGYPLRALVCLLILRELEPELGKHVEELATLYGKESGRLGRSVRMSLASTSIQLPGDLNLDDPPPAEELLPAAANIGAAISRLAAYPEKVPPLPLFSELPAETFARVLGAVKLLRKRPGEVILEQGQEGMAFYVLARGRVRVEREANGQKMVLAKLHGGAIFGEMALVSAEPRSATVVAEEDCDLLQFDKVALAAAASEATTVGAALDKFTRERLLTNLLGTAPLFRPLDRTQRLDLARRFKALDVAAGTAIIRDGDPGKGLYVVLSGGVEVWKTEAETGEKVLLANLGPGEVFGEISLLHEEAATANVSAAKKSTILFLARELFQRLVEAIAEIREYIENLGDERLMDTRLSMETTESEPLTDDDLLFI